MHLRPLLKIRNRERRTILGRRGLKKNTRKGCEGRFDKRRREERKGCDHGNYHPNYTDWTFFWRDLSKMQRPEAAKQGTKNQFLFE